MDDDDFAFGASVWGAPSDPSPINTTNLAVPIHDFPPSSASSGGDDDFDDFGTAQTAPSDAQDDDFGDFGDFGDPEDVTSPADFGDDLDFSQEVPIEEPAASKWEPIRLHPKPSRAELRKQLDDILGPLWMDDISEYTTADDVRQVEGVSQILVTAESRDLYNTIFHSAPPTKPPNWTRSRIRQQHLISLGIPVNLDELLPRASGKPLPPLQITTRPMSAPPTSRNATQPHGHSGSTAVSRSGTPQPSARSATSNISQLGIGPKPELDEHKLNELLALDADALTLHPLGTLERRLAEIRSQTVIMSSLLTHLLQTREALQQDSETYNGLIAELVNEAQKSKTGKTKQPTKRGSGMM